MKSGGNMEKNNLNTYKGIYAMHKYWGKKPFNEISKFIEKYSNLGDTVMDCFCGSGVTLIEAHKYKRNCIGVDINPLAILLSKVSLTPVDVIQVKKIFTNIEKKLKSKINSLYEIADDENNNTLITHTIWKKDEPVEVWYKTEEKKKVIRQGFDIDKTMANFPAIEPLWYPESIMFENSRINVGKDQKVSDLFTKRALVGLSLLLDEINQIEDINLKHVFQIIFSATLSQASKLVFVIRGRKKNGIVQNKAEVGSWVVGYWVPEEHFEINVWNCFENRYKRVLKGIEEIEGLFSANNQAVSLYNCSATEIPILDDSVDYVFIDPPHSNRILYMEMSMMWNAWLGMDKEINWSDEIVVSEAKTRNKTPENFYILMDMAFSEIARVLKPDKYFSLAFNCLDDNTWLNLLNLFIKYGFEICEVIPLEYSATSVVQDNRKNALKTDFVLTFKNAKNTSASNIYFNDDDILLEKKIKDIIRGDDKIEVYNIINKLFEDTIPKGYIFKVTSIVKVAKTLL